jgi:predicted amino acid-binding ACT domain protein
MTPLRVRVELVDQPGALAGLTAVLAALGVDVASVDVLELDGSTVVDELLLRLPAGVGAAEVEDALRMGGALDVLSSKVDGPSGDATVRALELVTAMVDAVGEAEDPGRALARVAYADLGRLVPVDEARDYPLASRALESGSPASGRARPTASPLVSPGGWVLWVAPSVPQPRRLAVVARRLDVRFSATEAARLRAFTTLLERAARVRP